jgi:hypothetical protein
MAPPVTHEPAASQPAAGNGVRAHLILASDRVSRGEREDRTAAGVRAVLQSAGVERWC